MINAYAIGVTATLEDNVSSRLMIIADWAEKANASMLQFTESVRKMSSAGGTLARSLDKAAAASTALGESSGGLTRASYVLDTMAASSADLARNMAAARAEGNGMGGGPVPGGGGGAGGRSAANGGGRAFETATGVTGAGMLYGAYENARLGDTNVKAVATSQVPMEQWGSATEDLRKRELDYAGKYAWATGGKIEPFGESILESARLMRTLSADKQKQMLDFAMPYIALESKLKGVSLPEATIAFIGLSHMAGAYDPKDAQPLYESMLQASLTSHASLEQIGKAASYALPSLHAAGANSSDVMLLIATLMQAGVTNTKAGTWLNAMAGNSLPNSLGSGLFSNKKQNKALHDLGLYKGNKSQFYKNGQMDLMKEVAILANDREKMAPLAFNALLKMAFGTQGQRFAAIFSEPAVVSNLHALSELKDFAQPPLDVGRAMQQVSTVARADQTIANANITLMNGTATLNGPVDWALGKANSAMSWTANYSKEHPAGGAALDVGMLFGAAVAGLGAWSGAKGAAGMLEKSVVGLTKFMARGAASMLTRAAAMVIAEDIGIAALGAAGGALALGLVIGGAIALAVAAGLKYALNNAIPTAPPPPGWTPKGIDAHAAHGVTTGHPSNARAQPVIHNHFHVDGQEVAAKLISPNTLGPTGFNQSAVPLRPGMSSSN